MDDNAFIILVALGVLYLYQRNKAAAAAATPQARLQAGLQGTLSNLLGTAGNQVQGLLHDATGGALGTGYDPGTEPGAVPSATGAQILNMESTGVPIYGYNASTGDTVEEDARLARLNSGTSSGEGVAAPTTLSSAQIDNGMDDSSSDEGLDPSALTSAQIDLGID